MRRNSVFQCMTGPLPLARWILTLVLSTTAAAAFVVNWTPNQLLSPLWHPAAKFQGALLLFFLAGACLTGIGAMWTHNSPQPIRIAALLSLSFWTPLFYITALLPESGAWAGVVEAMDPELGPALWVAGGAVLATLTAMALTFFGNTRKTEPPPSVTGASGGSPGRSFALKRSQQPG